MQVLESVRTVAVARGQGAWLAGLPGPVAELTADWGLTLGEVYPRPARRT